MANRSSFHMALPRHIKKLIRLIPDIDSHQEGEIRRLFIEAHARHKAFRARRSSREDAAVAASTDTEQ